MHRCVRLFSDQSMSDADLLDINALLQQLLPDSQSVKREEICELLGKGKLLVARSLREPRQGCHKIVAMATLVYFRQFVGLVGRIEDVVVDEKHRGQRIGTRLISKLLKKAKRLGLKHIDLTSHPGRQTANDLYKKLGFQLRDTNVYRRLISE